MRLKELRINSGLNQTEFAKKFGLSQATYSNYENESTQPDFQTLIKIADYYKISLDYLLEREQKNKLDLTSLSEIKKDCIEEIQSLTDEEVLAVTHFIAGLKQKDFIYKRG